MLRRILVRQDEHQIGIRSQIELAHAQPPQRDHHELLPRLISGRCGRMRRRQHVPPPCDNRRRWLYRPGRRSVAAFRIPARAGRYWRPGCETSRGGNSGAIRKYRRRSHLLDSGQDRWNKILPSDPGREPVPPRNKGLCSKISSVNRATSESEFSRASSLESGISFSRKCSNAPAPRRSCMPDTACARAGARSSRNRIRLLDVGSTTSGASIWGATAGGRL